MLGPIMIGVSQFELNFIEKKLLAHPHIGGVILFARNYHFTEQLKQLISSIQAVRIKANLSPALIAIDHEGGSVQRLRGETFTLLPTAYTVGCLYQKNPNRGRALVKAMATVTAYELGSLGIDLCLGPVLDLSPANLTPASSRQYTDNAITVSEIAKTYISELQAHGLSCAGKHFPGSGNETTNTHYGISISNASAKTLLNVCVKPYKALASSGILKAILLSHRIYMKLDDKPPAVSRVWLQDILRNQLRFEGVIITDCLQMTGAATMGKNLKSRIYNALTSGCDLVLCSHVCDGYYKEFYAALTDPELDYLINQRHEKSVIKLLALKRKYRDAYYHEGLQSKEYQVSVDFIRSVSDLKQQQKNIIHHHKILIYLKTIRHLRKLKSGKLFSYLFPVFKNFFANLYLFYCRHRYKKDT